MEKLKSFEEIIDYLQNTGVCRTVAVVWPQDSTTQDAVACALEKGFIKAVMVGCRKEVEGNPELMRHVSSIDFVEAVDPDDACAKAVALARSGKADVVMKGMVNTDNLLRAVLNKEQGILPKGRVLTHVTLAHIPALGRLLLFTDPAVIPYPTDDQRHAQVEYVVDLAHRLKIEEPRVSLVHCTEKVDERHFPFTADYRRLAEDSAAGKLGRCIVDGPLDVKTSLNPAAMAKKHIESPIRGEADALVFPDIEAGNAFYKTITLFADASVAGMLVGPSAPVVLPSRGDSVQSKFYSLALASI